MLLMLTAMDSGMLCSWESLLGDHGMQNRQVGSANSAVTAAETSAVLRSALGPPCSAALSGAWGCPLEFSIQQSLDFSWSCYPGRDNFLQPMQGPDGVHLRAAVSRGLYTEGKICGSGDHTAGHLQQVNSRMPRFHSLLRHGERSCSHLPSILLTSCPKS